MAKTIIDNSYNASSVGGGNGWYTFRTLVVENSTNTVNNTSNITVTFYAKYNFSGIGFTGYTSPKAIIKIDNVEKKRETVSSLDSNWKVIASWTGDITHNENGEKNITVLCTFEPNSTVSYLPGGNTTGGSGALTKIARYATITKFELSKKDETSVNFLWEASKPCDKIEYKLNNNEWTTGHYPITTITNLNPNTTYNVKIRVRAKDSQLLTESISKSITTYDYPHCTETPNFKIGDKITLKFYNPLGRSLKFYIISNGTQISNNWTISGTTYTGINGEDTQNQLYATIPNTKSATYQVKVVYGNITKTRNNKNTVSIKGIEVPTFSNFTYEDSKSTVVAVTGNKSFIVKNQSNLKVIISSANKMVAQKSATPKRYEISCGNRTATVNYATTDVSADLGTISVAGNTDIIVKAYDSRGLFTTKKITINIIDYVNIIQKNAFARLNNFENETTLVTKGSFSLVNCEGKNKNAIQSARYRYAKSNENYSSNWLSLIATISSNSYSCPNVVLDLDNQYSWKIQVEVKDKFTTSTIELRVSEGIPILYLNTDRKNVGIGKQNTNGGLYSLALAGDLILKNNQILDNLLPRYFYHNDKDNKDNNLDNYLTQGFYQLGKTYQNSPNESAATFGALIVITSRHLPWTPEDLSNWIWQFLLETNGNIYMRYAVNNEIWTSWKLLNDSGTYLLSGDISKTVGDIPLCDSINNYDYLIAAVGAVNDETYIHSQLLPFTSEFVKGKKTRAKWRINTDIPVAIGANGTVSFTIPNEMTLRIKSNTNNISVRGIYGVKL